MTARDKKKIYWAASVLTLIVFLVSGLWFFPIGTVMFLIIGWISFMVYLDPPENWNL